MAGTAESTADSTSKKRSKSNPLSSARGLDRSTLLEMAGDFFRFLTGYVHLAPSSFASGLDLLNLFDTVFQFVVNEDRDARTNAHQWAPLVLKIGSAEVDSSSENGAFELGLLDVCLDLLQEATMAQLCRWIPSQEELARSLSNALLGSTWQNFAQKSMLRKLLVLTTRLQSHHHHDASGIDTTIGSISSKALGILRTIFYQLELLPVSSLSICLSRYEFDAWVATAGMSEDFLCGVDLLIKLTASFQQPLQIKLFQLTSLLEVLKTQSSAYLTGLKLSGSSSDSNAQLTMDPSAALSPLITCNILLACGDLDIFADYLPSNIRNHHLDTRGEEDSRVGRYSDAFGSLFQRLLCTTGAATSLFSGGASNILTQTRYILQSISGQSREAPLLASASSTTHLVTDLGHLSTLLTAPLTTNPVDAINFLENAVDDHTRSGSITQSTAKLPSKRRKVGDTVIGTKTVGKEELAVVPTSADAEMSERSSSQSLVLDSFHQFWNLISTNVSDSNSNRRLNAFSVSSKVFALTLTVSLARRRSCLDGPRLEFISAELQRCLDDCGSQLPLQTLPAVVKLLSILKSRKIHILGTQKPVKRARSRSNGDLSKAEIDSSHQNLPLVTLDSAIQSLENMVLGMVERMNPKSIEYVVASLSDGHFADSLLAATDVPDEFCLKFLNTFLAFLPNSKVEGLNREARLSLQSFKDKMIALGSSAVWTDEMLHLGWLLHTATQDDNLAQVLVHAFTLRPESFAALSFPLSNDDERKTILFHDEMVVDPNTSATDVNGHTPNPIPRGCMIFDTTAAAILKSCPPESLLKMKLELEQKQKEKNNFISKGFGITVGSDSTGSLTTKNIKFWTDIASLVNSFHDYDSEFEKENSLVSAIPQQLKIAIDNINGLLELDDWESVHQSFQSWRLRVAESTNSTKFVNFYDESDSNPLMEAVDSLLTDPFVEDELVGLRAAVSVLSGRVRAELKEQVFVQVLCPLILVEVSRAISRANEDRSTSKQFKLQSMNASAVWVALYCRLVESVCDHLTSRLVTSFDQPQHKDHSFPLLDKLSFECSFKLLAYLLQCLRAASMPSIIESLATVENKVQKKLIKCIKTGLKLGIEEPIVLDGLCTIMKSLYDLSFNDDKSQYANMYRTVISDFHHPAVLFQMAVCHSKFFDSLRERRSSCPLLLFVLMLLSYVTTNDLNRLGGEQKSFIDTAAALTKHLLSTYRGTMTLVDRIILRILHTLADLKAIEDVHKLQLEVAPTRPSGGEEVSAGAARFSLLPCSWMFQSVKQSLVYTTLSDFPVDRCVTPAPIKGESAMASEIYQEKLLETYQSLGQAYILQSEDSVHYDESTGDSDMELDETKMDEDFHIEVNMKLLKQLGVKWVDEQMQSANASSVYDPAFWLPVILYRLKVTSDISLRLFCNSGLLAIVVAAVGSDSLPTRVTALAILYTLLCKLSSQTLAQDPAFRARTQIILLLKFMKNSIERAEKSTPDQNDENGDLTERPCKVPSFPRSTILFFALSAMHLMQPGHELYGKVNKYLLSRPFCDVKDVPLFDLLVMEGDSTTAVISQQRVEVLRMIRDTLNDRLDHLNLCRKNAYSRLMGMYAIYTQDHKVGNTILDIIEKGLSLRDSSRYLMQRCNIASWIHQLGIESSDDCTIGGDRINALETAAKTKHSGSKLQHRRMKLLRRLVNAAFLLYSEGLISVLDIRHLFTILTCVVDEVLDAYQGIVQSGEQMHSDFEYLSLVILVIWEMTILLRRILIDDSVVKDDLQWGFVRIESLSHILLRFTDDNVNGASDLLTTVLLIGSMLGSSGNATQSRVFLKLSCHVIIHRLKLPSLSDAAVFGMYPSPGPQVANTTTSDKNLTTTDAHVFLFPASDVYVHAEESGKYQSMESLFLATWREFSAIEFKSHSFRSAAIGTKELSTLLLGASLRSITCSGDDERSLFDNMPLLRVCLLLYNFLFRLEAQVYSSSRLATQASFRLLSLADSIQISAYDSDFIDFQLIFRLCYLGLVTVLPILAQVNDPALDAVKSSLFHALTYLVQGDRGVRTETQNLRNSPDLLRSLGIASVDRSFDGLDLWKSMKASGSRHSEVMIVLNRVMHLVSAIATALDRDRVDGTTGLVELCKMSHIMESVNSLSACTSSQLSAGSAIIVNDDHMDLSLVLSTIFTSST